MVKLCLYFSQSYMYIFHKITAKIKVTQTKDNDKTELGRVSDNSNVYISIWQHCMYEYRRLFKEVHPLCPLPLLGGFLLCQLSLYCKMLSCIHVVPKFDYNLCTLKQHLQSNFCHLFSPAALEKPPSYGASIKGHRNHIGIDF